jgi:hypothetical protein
MTSPALTPEQEQAVEEAVKAAWHTEHVPGCIDCKALRPILRDLVARVTEPWSHHTAGTEWPKCKLCRNDLKDILAENKRLDAALERISTLEGLLREYRGTGELLCKPGCGCVLARIDAALKGEPQ